MYEATARLIMTPICERRVLVGATAQYFLTPHLNATFLPIMNSKQSLAEFMWTAPAERSLVCHRLFDPPFPLGVLHRKLYYSKK
jgi:hypothetical protein